MMRFDGDCRPRRTDAIARASPPSSRRQLAGSILALSLCAGASVTLAGCGLDNGPGSLLVDPGRYSVMHCKDLVTTWNALLMREDELRKLQDRASEGTGGALIGNISYRADYEAVLSDKKIVQHEAAAKNCELERTYQSDQSIR
jgi:hypothetical protein